jgi:hypothetical protein
LQSRLPIRSLIGSRLPLFIVLSALSLTFAPAAANEGDAVSWPDGTVARVQPEVAQGAITFDTTRTSTQQKLIDISQTKLPATVINLKLDDFRPLKLEVVDLDGNLIKTLADGLWAEGVHQMAWYHQNEQDELLENGLYVLRLTPEPTAAEGLALAR